MSFTPVSELRNALYGIMDFLSRISFLAEIRDTIGGIRVSVANTPAVTVSGNLTTVTTVTTVTTCGTVNNQTNIGGVNAQPQIPALMNLEAMTSNIENILIT